MSLKKPSDQMKPLVLVVDDDVTTRTVLVMQLHRLGVTADSAANGVEALRRVRETDYNMILMDGEMPEMDGYVTTAAIRFMHKEQCKTERPIIGVMSDPDVERGTMAGMNEIIKKPLELSQMKTLVERWLPAAEN